MSIPSSLTPLFNSGSSGGALQVSRSLRFNSADSAYLSRTPAVAGNRRTWTWSAWVKRSKFGSYQSVFYAGSSEGNRTGLSFTDSENLSFFHKSGGSVVVNVSTIAVFRDPSAWYHVVIAFGSTQATASQRLRAYVNGVEYLFGSNSVGLNDEYFINTTNAHFLGTPPQLAEFYSGYLANIHLIDGQQLTPSSFTETDATTGQLIPKTYTGSYGTNGFNLLFADNSSNTASTLGKDYSGLSNNWTPNNLSVTAGAGNDSLVDSPTNYGTDTGVGGEVRGNYATLNPLDISTGGTVTLSNGNLDWQVVNGNGGIRGTFAVSTGKWYFEFTYNEKPSGGGTAFGVLNVNDALGFVGTTSGGYSYYSEGASYTRKYNNNVPTNYGASFAPGDVIGVALDLDAGTITFYNNGASQGQAFSGLSGTFAPACCSGTGTGTARATLNAGQRAFAYTAPSGFKALCTQNLPAPLVTKSNTVMDVALYTGTGANQTITGLGFSPDLVWIKGRSFAAGHILNNTVAGAGTSKSLYSNATDSQGAYDVYGYLSAFTSDGFTTQGGTDPTDPYNLVSKSSQTYVAWAWDAGTSTVSNTQGSITSQVRANATAGFSVVGYTGNAVLNATIGHGLGAAPRLIFVKSRSAAEPWIVLTTVINGSQDYGILNSTAAFADDIVSATPTSTVFSISNGSAVNGNTSTYVAYCFAPVVGYSSFGSYTGNGSTDGPFVYTGFRPRWILYKRSDSGTGSGNWNLVDTSRSTYNVSQTEVIANNNIAEFTSSNANMDILSNGFKIRTTDASRNESAKTFIYAAFAEMPFNYSRAR